MTVLVLFVSVVVVAAVGASNYYGGLTHLDELQQVPQGQNSAIYARDGSRLTVIASDKNRRYVSLDRISPWLPAATIAIEDRRFYEHHGVDWKAVGRAAVEEPRGRARGRGRLDADAAAGAEHLPADHQRGDVQAQAQRGDSSPASSRSSTPRSGSSSST